MDLASIQTELHNVLRSQMTRATYDTHIVGTRLIEAGPERWLMATSSAQSLEWLQSPHLHPLIEAAAQRLAGHPVAVEIELAQNGNGHHAPPPAAPLEVGDLPADLQPDSPDLQAARADLLSVYFGKGTVGYDSVPKEVVKFKAPVLGPDAFTLWQTLCSDDNRQLKTIAPNFWTPPTRYSLEELAARVNKTHPRYVGGDALECERSRVPRLEGRPLQQIEDCCGSERYALLWFKGLKCGLKCLHWSTGLIEVLQAAKLMRIEAQPTGYKPLVQVWRLPGLITPYQYHQLQPYMQTVFDNYIQQHAQRYGLAGEREWEQIGTDYLEPLMPGYDEAIVGNDWRRPIRDKFLKNAQPNPKFCHGHGRKSEAD